MKPRGLLRMNKLCVSPNNPDAHLHGRTHALPPTRCCKPPQTHNQTQNRAAATMPQAAGKINRASLAAAAQQMAD
jgi:hypothetical protein